MLPHDIVDLRFATRSDVAIGATQPPLHSNTREELIKLIDAEADAIRASIMQQLNAALLDAEAAERTVRERAMNHRPLVERAQKEFDDIPVPYLFRGLVAAIAFCAALPAEWALNWTVIPWVLSVPKYSVTAIALSVAPTLASVALELVLNPLFATDSVWDAQRTRPTFGTWVHRIWTQIPLVATGVLALMSPLLVAKLRPVVAAMLTSPGSIRERALELQPLIDQAMLWLALALVVIATMLYIFAATQFRRGWRRWRLGRLSQRLRAAQDRCNVALAEASAVVEHRRKLVCDSETIAAIESRLFVQERVVKVSQLDEMMGTPERQVGRILRRKSRW